MREIKFRGLDIESNSWCYGGIDKDIKRIVENNSRHPFRAVDEETICEYTSLKDKNNKEIYTGDILTCDIYPFKDNGKPNYNAEVYWEESCLQFCIRLYCVNAEKRGISDGVCEALTDRIDDISECQFEVIGNIYENINLLKAN